jgi:EmrB/QacA subfamily drug resistance transporter
MDRAFGSWRSNRVPLPSVSQKITVCLVYTSTMFIAVMDQTIVNVALPSIARGFHTTSTSIAAVVIGYLVSLAVFIPASSWLGSRFGLRRTLLCSILVFTIGSALCGVAANLGELVAFRVLQGVGGGLMVPVGLTLLFAVFPVEERARVGSILLIPTVLAPATGPIIGGLFVTYASWRWVFYVNVPIGLFAVIFGSLFLFEHRPDTATKFDTAGFLTAGLGLGSLMYGVSYGPNIGWTAPRVISTLIVGVVLLTAMVFIELRSPRPLLDLRIYADRLFRSTSIVLTITSVAFYGLIYLLSLFLQSALGVSALSTGLTIFPEAIGVILISQFLGRILYPVIGPRRILATGLLILAAAALFLSRVDAGTSIWVIRATTFLMGFGVAGAFMPSQAAGFATIPPAKTGVASTIFNAQRQLGGAIGVAGLTAVIAVLHPVHYTAGKPVANLQAFHVAFLVVCGLALVAAAAALTVSDADAAHTMVRRRKQSPRQRTVAPTTAVAGSQDAPPLAES